VRVRTESSNAADKALVKKKDGKEVQEEVDLGENQ